MELIRFIQKNKIFIYDGLIESNLKKKLLKYLK